MFFTPTELYFLVEKLVAPKVRTMVRRSLLDNLTKSGFFSLDSLTIDDLVPRFPAMVA